MSVTAIKPVDTGQTPTPDKVDKALAKRLMDNQLAQKQLRVDLQTLDTTATHLEQKLEAARRATLKAREAFSSDPSDSHRAALDSARKDETLAGATLVEFQTATTSNIGDDLAALQAVERSLRAELVKHRHSPDSALHKEFEALQQRMAVDLPRWYALALITSDLKPGHADLATTIRTKIPLFNPMADGGFQKLWGWINAEKTNA